MRPTKAIEADVKRDWGFFKAAAYDKDWDELATV
jgi:hypothetical protein